MIDMIPSNQPNDSVNDGASPDNGQNLHPRDTLNAIRKRRTIKALSDTPLPTHPADEALIATLIESAYWAPFHYPAHGAHQSHWRTELPFRFYVLDSATCRALAQHLQPHQDEAGKVIGLLHSADYLIQATWTPQPHDGAQLFEPSLTNMEHIAGAGAAIQNLLLTATALGHENYWGSGGILRKAPFNTWWGMAENEILLGSLFLFPSEVNTPESVTFKTSPKRHKRGQISDCYRWVSL